MHTVGSIPCGHRLTINRIENIDHAAAQFRYTLGNDNPSIMRTTKSNWLALLFLLTGLSTGCSDWQHNVTVSGVAFSKVRIADDGLAIGQLKADTIISGSPCKQGWVHVRANGVPAGFTASQEIDVGRFKIPVATWVFQDKEGVVTACAFPRDVEVQGHWCSGSGGPEGIQTAFYPDGALRQYFLRRDTRIQDVPCQSGLLDESVELYPNGRLKACVLGEESVREGRTYRKGTRIHFNADGRIA